MELKKGERVKHPARPEWGLGKVLEDSLNGKARVLFKTAGEKLVSLEHVALTPVTGAEAHDPSLDVVRKAAPKRRKEYKDIEQLRTRFLTEFPGGFASQHFFKEEREYKLAACDLMQELLNAASFGELLAASDYAEICKRALQVVNKTNLIFPNEKMSLKDGLKTSDGQKRFAESLYQLLYGQSSLAERFTQYADCLLALGAAKWTTATYFLFITYPECQMFMKPVVTQDAAAVCGFTLNYWKDPNWDTYQRLLAFAEDLKAKLTDLEPKDMIDIQSFIWLIAQD